MKIGFFDSGLGGLTILKSTTRVLPEYDYVFYGDTAHLPLGDKTEEEIFEYTKVGVRELFRRDCVLVIIACNTASAETLRRLQDTFLPENYPDRRILGVIIPTIETLTDSDSKDALLIATKRTVDSGKYALELQHRTSRKINLSSVSTPILVPLIEAGKGREAEDEAIKIIDKVLKESNLDTIILGCTHYAILKEGLRIHYKNKVKIISQEEIIPIKLTGYLEKHGEIKSRLSHGKTRSIKLTLHRPDYDQTTEELLSKV